MHRHTVAQLLLLPVRGRVHITPHHLLPDITALLFRSNFCCYAKRLISCCSSESEVLVAFSFSVVYTLIIAQISSFKALC